MLLNDLFENKWWDSSEVIRLYHGTTSAYLPIIQAEGLQPPQKQTDEYALDILEQYVPRSEWTDELIDEIRERCGRIKGGREGDYGQVIFCMTDIKGPSGYARSLAKHGGEIAKDVYDTACLFLTGQHLDLDELPYREYKTMERPIQPRFPEGQAIVLEMLVPKKWCLFCKDDVTVIKNNIDKARAEGKDWAIDDPVEQIYDEVFENREVRIARTVPTSMILDVHYV